MRGGCPLRRTCFASCRLWTGNVCCAIVQGLFVSCPGAVNVASVYFYLDVLEVCLTESGQHEGLVIARERYKRFQVPRSLGKEVIRAG